MIAVAIAAAYLAAELTWGRGRVCREVAERYAVMARLYSGHANVSDPRLTSGNCPLYTSQDRDAYRKSAEKAMLRSRFYREAVWQPWVALPPIEAARSGNKLLLFSSLAEPLAWLAIPAGLLLGVAKFCRSCVRRGPTDHIPPPAPDATEP
jgi:hypothetical protein